MSMTLAQAQKWLAESGKTIGKYGFANENRKIMKEAKRIIRQSFKDHKSPLGVPWPKTDKVDNPKHIHLGYRARIGTRYFDVKTVSEGRAIAKFYNKKLKEGRAIAKFYKKKLKDGKEKYKFVSSPGKVGGLQALYRGGKKNPAKRMRDKMAGIKGTPGHIERDWKTGFEVGGYGSSLENHNEGKGKKKKRTFAEVTPELQKFAEQVYADRIEKIMMKG
jgi:hypothetical protein